MKDDRPVAKVRGEYRMPDRRPISYTEWQTCVKVVLDRKAKAAREKRDDS